MTGKFWCFTENDNPRTFWANVTDACEASPNIKYMCGQLETASTGQLHFQGYVQLGTSQRLSWLRNNISSTAHWERQKGTNEEARDYCAKEDATTVANTFIEYGTFQAGRGGGGARNDLAGLVQAIKEEKTQREIIETPDLLMTYAKFLKFHDRVRSLYKPKANEEGVKVILYVGEPGAGKTRRALTEFPELFEIPISNGTLWLDGYDGQEEVLFDDFMGKGSKMTLDNTLKFFDRYVRCVPIKGAYVWWKPKIIVVSSNYHPRFWYEWKDREPSYKALCRRFHEVWFFHNEDEVEKQDSVEDYFYDHDQWPQIELTYQ